MLRYGLFLPVLYKPAHALYLIRYPVLQNHSTQSSRAIAFIPAEAPDIRVIREIARGAMSYCLNYRIGGAWGHKWFESDHDQDIVAHLSANMGICKYNPEPQMQDSLLHPHHRAFLIRIILPTELDQVFKKYFDMLQDYKTTNVEATRRESFLIDSPRYYIFVLGLLAMQLGCTLSRRHRRWMKDNLVGCLLNEERLQQAKMALEKYKDGKPLVLGSKTLNERIVSLADGKGDWVLGKAIKVPHSALDVELVITRMHLDNEVAKAKGATATKGVDISNALTDEPNIAAFEEVAKEKARNTDVPEACIDMAPESGLLHWLANEAARKRWGKCEHAKYGLWVRDQSSDDEMRVVFAELLRSGRLAALDK